MTAHDPIDRVLAVDIGTSSVRAMVFDAAGRVMAGAQIAYPTRRPALYFEEQDPDLVRREVYRAMAQCLGRPEAMPQRVGAIAFSSQLYGIIALDDAERPLTANILWSDGRAEAQAEALKLAHGPLGLYPHTGCPTNSIFPLAKLAWLQEVQPDVFRAARRYVSIKEYVTRPLVGAWAVDHSMASATGLLDIHRHRWHAAALDAAGVHESQLSPPVSGLEPFPLRADSPLSGCGLRPDVRVFLGAGDGPLANLGSGASRVGDVNIDLGTSGAARCVVDRATTDGAASLWCFCLTDALWTYGGIVTNVGNAWRWLAGVIHGEAGLTEEGAYERMNRRAAEVAPGANGLHFLPYLRKTRAPTWDGRLKGTLYGLTADHGAGHITRALLEAVAYDLRTIVGLMRREVPVTPVIVLTGGLARSRVLPQLLADVLGVELFAPEDGEGSIAGAALLALRGLRLIDGLAFAGERRPGRTYVPDDDAAERYGRSYAAHLRLVEALRTLSLDQGAGS